MVSTKKNLKRYWRNTVCLPPPSHPTNSSAAQSLHETYLDRPLGDFLVERECVSAVYAERDGAGGK